MITLGIDKNDPTRNVVKAYKPKGGAAAPAPAPAAATPTNGTATGGAAPWARS